MLSGSKVAFKAVATATTDDALNGGASVTPAARAGFRVVVWAVALTQGSAAGAITFNSKPAGAGTAVTAAFTPAASAVMVLPYNPQGWFETNTGEGLTVTTGATTSAVAINVVWDYKLAAQ